MIYAKLLLPYLNDWFCTAAFLFIISSVRESGLISIHLNDKAAIANVTNLVCLRKENKLIIVLPPRNFLTSFNRKEMNMYFVNKNWGCSSFEQPLANLSYLNKMGM